MTDYEMMYILRPDLPEEQVQQEVTRYREFLEQYNAENLNIKIWGKRRLAYPIGKFQDGIYVLVNYTADGKQVAPLERAMRLSEQVIRYMTIKLPNGKIADAENTTHEKESIAKELVTRESPKKEPVTKEPTPAEADLKEDLPEESVSAEVNPTEILPEESVSAEQIPVEV